MVEQILAKSLDNIKPDSYPSGVELNSKITPNVVPSEDNAEMQVYILAVGTTKRDLEGVSKLIPSHIVHKRLLSENTKVVDGVECLPILVDHHIKHQVLLHDGFSWTQEWGFIHNFYVKIIGSQNIAYGAAALLGKMLNEQAIGIYHPITKEEDYQILNLQQGQMLPDNFHQYFKIYSNNVLSDDMILKIIKHVCKRFPELSGQLDISGQSIEFHDYYSAFKGTSIQIEEILKESFQQIFPIETQFSKSTLLVKSDYDQAINGLNF